QKMPGDRRNTIPALSVVGHCAGLGDRCRGGGWVRSRAVISANRSCAVHRAQKQRPGTGKKYSYTTEELIVFRSEAQVYLPELTTYVDASLRLCVSPVTSGLAQGRIETQRLVDFIAGKIPVY